ncbi:hypothetical protein AKJ09_01075 [Labilithrix luteola]|uniref:Uncharacterized protein n=1 Tax=Labilithrix luteola TaxID=1391654 RepID=A0A0K1PLZ1_9BACT|nr:hypothetical protein [Labilithrix luteola]AKU94411.1 hypothetical protein AKJ09_01075 [Labilithrix luteola]
MKRTAWGLALAFALVPRAVSAEADGRPSLRLPAPATSAYARGSREQVNARCVACHAGVARDHDGSLHAQAFVEPSFQKGYAIEPAAFCRSCHAPEHGPATEPDAFARSHGVACVTCHVPDANGTIVTGEGHDTGSNGPHAVKRIPNFGTRACTSCHEFAFPNSGSLGEKGLMQKTATEHATSTYGDRTCTTCHMPKSDSGRRSHRFTASRDATMLAAALHVKASREANGHLSFELSSLGVGHAFPTGDLFRRLVLRLKTARGVREQSFERSFRATRDPANGKTSRFEATDTRLAPSRRFELDVAAPEGGCSWELVYQRVTGVGQTPPFTADVEAETVLARGTL